MVHLLNLICGPFKIIIIEGIWFMVTVIHPPLSSHRDIHENRDASFPVLEIRRVTQTAATEREILSLC